jgi:hypothetical protein
MSLIWNYYCGLFPRRINIEQNNMFVPILHEEDYYRLKLEYSIVIDQFADAFDILIN